MGKYWFRTTRDEGREMKIRVRVVPMDKCMASKLAAKAHEFRSGFKKVILEALPLGTLELDETDPEKHVVFSIEGCTTLYACLHSPRVYVYIDFLGNELRDIANDLCEAVALYIKHYTDLASQSFVMVVVQFIEGSLWMFNDTYMPLDRYDHVPASGRKFFQPVYGKTEQVDDLCMRCLTPLQGQNRCSSCGAFVCPED